MASNFWSKIWPLRPTPTPIENTKRRHWTTLLQETSLKDQAELGEITKFRLIVFRESRSKARRCLFDSDTVIREDLTVDVGLSPREEFVQVFEEKYGYKYQPKKKDVNRISEMIFGSVPVAHGGRNFKLFPMDNPEDILLSFLTDIVKTKSASNGSSFNSSFGSSVSTVSLDGTSPSELQVPRGFQDFPSPRVSRPDSGIYAHSTASRPTEGSNCSSIDHLLMGQSYHSGHLQEVDSKGWESDLSLQLRVRSMMETGSLGSIPQVLPSCQPGSLTSNSSFRAVVETPSSKESLNVPSVDNLAKDVNSFVDYLQVRVPAASSPDYTTLGVGLLISCPMDLQQVLLESQSFIDETLGWVKQSTSDALEQKQQFAHLMYKLWEKINADLLSFFQSQRLAELAWHQVSQCTIVSGKTLISEERDNEPHFFIHELGTVLLKLEHKSNMFFFSNILSAVLTHHLGWVGSIRPSFGDHSNSEETSPKLFHIGENAEKLSSVWFNPFQLQYKSLYGMIGFPPRACKTVVIGANESLLQSLMYVLSYFIRCSIVIKNRCETEVPNLDQIITQHIPVGTNPSAVPPSSGEIPQRSKVNQMRRVHTTIAHLEDSDRFQAGTRRPPLRRQSSASEEVTFIVGENERLLTPATLAAFKERSSVKDQDFQRLTKEGSSNSSGMGAMISGGTEDGSSFDCFDNQGREDVMLPMPRFEILPKGPKNLHAFTCIHDSTSSLMPGAVLQGILVNESTGPISASSLRSQLRAFQRQGFLFPQPMEATCIVAEVCSSTVSQISSQNNGLLPLCGAPIVAKMVDSLLSAMDKDPVEILCLIEDHLQGMLLQSYLLSEYLLTTADLSQNLRKNIKDNLDIDQNDLQLLMAIASVHTPEISKKFGLSFVQDMNV
ncbi:folliculin-interacting protein 2-like isoform X2 [Tigriopus californicus]|uniref:folliculin-interacting protein 2-like isoform X2 n=1 Tax=Tigriopus californicus TaxID=6832 RepID=UPI0027DA8E8C|nr:folliculin-interacting protein 2-like isoform X2 [Tigriopus californicus]